MKVAKSLKGKVNVAAVDCDAATNKPLCAEHGVQGFPTIKMMKPIKDKLGKRSLHIEDYQGERTAKAIAEHATGMMPHKVERLTSDKVDKFLKSNPNKAIAILFTKKGTISGTYKALSTAFSRGVVFAQIRDNQAAALDRFSITGDLPQLVVLSKGTETVNKYEGESKFESMRAFIESHIPEPVEGEDEEAPVAEEEASKTTTAAEPHKVSSFLQFSRIETVAGIESECFEPDSRPCLLAPSPLLTDSAFATKHKMITFVEYDGQAVKALEERELPVTEVIYVNGKKSWFLSAGPEVKSKVDIIAFIDKVKQGEAGAKKQFTTVLKDEL